jgi:serine/threonine protein kinase
MEYIPDAVPITLYKSISKHFELWKTDLNIELVTTFHNEGFVHDDLRDANIISGNDGHVKVIDFDWGPKLNRELVEGRPSGGLTITNIYYIFISNDVRTIRLWRLTDPSDLLVSTAASLYSSTDHNWREHLSSVRSASWEFSKGKCLVFLSILGSC